LITWEYAADASAVADDIAGILPRQWGAHRVMRFVEWHYAVAISTVTELASYAARPSRNPYRAREVDGRISCGHHPWLEARIVADLVVETNEDLFEIVSWKEPDRWRLDEQAGRPVRVAEGARRTVKRRLRGALSSEHIWDRSAGSFKPGWEPGASPAQPY